MRESELRAFVTAARMEKLRDAAVELGYSTSGLSYQLRGLERALLVKLFVRHSSGLRLSPKGSVVLPAAQLAVDALDHVRRVAVGSPVWPTKTEFPHAH